MPGRWPENLYRLGLRGAAAISRLPNFPQTLDYVDLAGTKSLEELPAERGQPRTLFLYGTGIRVPPKSEHGQDAGENVAARTQTFFNDVALVGEGDVKRCKLLVLGNGSAGKTCLSLALTGGDPRDAQKLGSTHAVQFLNWEMDALVKQLFEPVHVHVWDFGGQDIYHNTHRLFMSKGTVFVVVWNPDQDDRQPDPTDVHQDKWRPLGYWFDFIHLACPDKPQIAIVCSHRAAGSEELAQRWRDQVDQKYHDDTRCFYIDSLHAPEDLAAHAGELEGLREWLTHEVGRVIAVEGTAVPSYWEIAQQMVQGWVQRLEHDAEFARSHNEISFSQFRDELQAAMESAVAGGGSDDSPSQYKQLATRLQTGEFSLTDERVRFTLSFLTHGGWLYWVMRNCSRAE